MTAFLRFLRPQKRHARVCVAVCLSCLSALSLHAAEAVEKVEKSGAAAAPSVWRLLLGLIIVLGVIFAAAWVLRRGPLVSGGSTIRVLASCIVGTRERVVLIQCGDKQLLLGVTAQQITPLHTFDQPVVSAESVPNNRFAEQLAQLMQKKVSK